MNSFARTTQILPFLLTVADYNRVIARHSGGVCHRKICFLEIVAYKWCHQIKTVSTDASARRSRVTGHGYISSADTSLDLSKTARPGPQMLCYAATSGVGGEEIQRVLGRHC